MRTFPKLLALTILGLSSVLAFAAAPATLTLNDLRNNPERWPASVAIPRDLQFQGGLSVKKGQVVKVVELEGANVVVDAGKSLVFGFPLAETDFVARANEAWAKLTPEQREISGEMLANDHSLWPVSVKCNAEFRFNNGTTIPAGGEFELQSVSRDAVKLYSAQHNATLNTSIQSTDLLERARALALVPAEKRPSRIAAVLHGQLVDSTGKPAEPAKLEETQVFALYYGASWCGPCRRFSPDFVKFVNRVGPANPRLTVVMMSNDKSDAELFGYMKEEKMPWLAMPLDRIEKVPSLVAYTKGGIPQLVVVDRQGQVLADSYEGSNYLGPQAAMQELEKILATGVAK